ncbi:hypothetical protein [Streptomyces sp. NPDC003401]
MTLYGIKPAHIAGFSFLCLAAATVQLYRHDGPFWLTFMAFVAVAWSNGRWRVAAHARQTGRADAGALTGPAFFIMLLAPFVSAAALLWGLLLER